MKLKNFLNMIKAELYHKCVQILFNAYFNDTLVHGSCSACAIGNLVGANCGYTLSEDKYSWIENFPSWNRVFMTAHGEQHICAEDYIGVAKHQIDSTGYTWRELAKIEFAFETADQGRTEEDYMFNGLVAVLEVLREIHQVADEDLLTSNTKRFTDHYHKRTAQVQST